MLREADWSASASQTAHVMARRILQKESQEFNVILEKLSKSWDLKSGQLFKNWEERRITSIPYLTEQVLVCILADRFLKETKDEFATTLSCFWEIYNHRMSRVEDDGRRMIESFMRDMASGSDSTQAMQNAKLLAINLRTNYRVTSVTGTTQGKAYCRRWNTGECNFDNCKFKHQCFLCNKAHPVTKCPRGGRGSGGKGKNKNKRRNSGGSDNNT